MRSEDEMTGCPCCDGLTDFDWYADACDECAAEIVNGSWDVGHPHDLSDLQRKAVNHD